MNIRGSPDQPLKKKATAKSLTKGEQGKTLSQGCCRGFKDCKIMGSTLSSNRHQQQSSNGLEHKVADLEREVQNLKEACMAYRKRMESAQQYLRYCLQIVQDNGLMEFLVHSKGDPPQQSLLSTPTSCLTSPHQMPTPHRQHAYLAAITDEAHQHGWYIDPSEIELVEKIARGSTANIYRGTWRGMDVAVKCLTAEFFSLNENGGTFFAQEVETLSRQRHRYVLRLMGACLHPPRYAWIVTEVLSTNLKDWLHGPGKRQRERVVPVPALRDRVSKAAEIAEAMQYLHEQKPKVIHRDLKPSNIFLDDGLHVRIADFGHARFLNDEEMALTGETGTYVYMAPEVIRSDPYTEKCDVYSFGIILNEILTGNYPYIEINSPPAKIAMDVVEENRRPMLPSKCDGEMMKELVHLICLCWNRDPSFRPSFATVTSSIKNIVNKLGDNNT